MFKAKFPRRYKPKPIRIPVRKQLDWSHHQKNIFQNVASGDDHLMIDAVAGSSKTTSIVESMYYLPEEYLRDNRTLFTTFGSAAAKHLADQIPNGVIAKTHHQLGFHTVLKHWGPVYSMNGHGCVDSGEYGALELAKKEIGDSPDFWRIHLNLVAAMNMAKTVLADCPQKVENVLYDYAIDIGELSPEDFAGHVWNMMEATRNEPMIHNGRSMISFVDMIWLPHVHGWMPEQFDRVYCDEVQDTNPARFELMMKSLSLGGRMFVVGDPLQAIFSWAGVNPNVCDLIEKALKANKLPLSVCYRCPKTVIALAKKINPNIEAANNAIDGKVDYFDAESLLDRLEPGIAILSRTNFPLIKLCFKLLSKGTNVNIQGRDLGERLTWRVNSWRPLDIPALINSIHDWRDMMVERLTIKRRPTITVMDEANSLECFAQNCSTVAEVKQKIKTFFSDEETQIKLSSVHRFKGLEKNKVYLLDKTFRGEPEPGSEEERIRYVAITRSKEYLGIAEGKLPW